VRDKKREREAAAIGDQYRDWVGEEGGSCLMGVLNF